MDAHFNVEAHSREVVIIRIGEALDFRNVARFKAVCLAQLRSGARTFILDFQDTSILDSTGMGAILGLYRRVAPVRGKVIFAATSGAVEALVHITRVHRVFPLLPSAYAAVEALYAKPRAAGYTGRT